MFFDFEYPEYLWLLSLSVPIVYWGVKSLKTMDKLRRWVAIGLRLLLLLLIVLMLSGLQLVKDNDSMTVIALLDQSESIRKFARPPSDEQMMLDTHQTFFSIEQWQEAYIREAIADRRMGDRVGVTTFTGRPIVRFLPTEKPNIHANAVVDAVEGTDIAAAIRSAIAQFDVNSAGEIVLVSDLNDGHADDVIAAAHEAAMSSIPIHVLPVPYKIEKEVMVEGVYVAKKAVEGENVSVRVLLRSTSPAYGELEITHNDRVVGIEKGKLQIWPEDWTYRSSGFSGIEGDPRGAYVAVKIFDLPVDHAGMNTFTAEFEGDETVDYISANNRATAVCMVEGHRSILYMTQERVGELPYLAEVLSKNGLAVEVVAAEAFEYSLGELQKYDAIMMDNVPVDAVESMKQNQLASYVKVLGGGLLVLGGCDSYGAGGWTNSVLDKEILPVSCEVVTETLQPTGALVLVIDCSKSMSMSVGQSSVTRQLIANQAALESLRSLYPQDLVGVIAFNQDAHVVWNVDWNTSPIQLAKRVEMIHSSGGTDIYKGLLVAYEKLAPLTIQQGAVKHVILMTDGLSFEGDYVGLLEKMERDGITLSTVGIGDSNANRLLEDLARMGGGRYHPVKNPHRLPQVFLKEAKKIRKNLINESDSIKVCRHDFSTWLVGKRNLLPTVKGYVRTGVKKDPRIVIPWMSDENEPLLAYKQAELGRVAAFMADANQEWAIWDNGKHYADFWVSLIKEIARPGNCKNVEVYSELVGDKVQVKLDVANIPSNDVCNSCSFRNNLKVQGRLAGPNGGIVPANFRQTGPGLYEAELPINNSGNYILGAVVQADNEEMYYVTSGITKPAGLELKRFRTNWQLIKQVAEITGGRVLAGQPQNLFAGERMVTHIMQPMWRELLFVFFVFLLLDIANRRVTWELMELQMWFGKQKKRVFMQRTVTSEETFSSIKDKFVQSRQSRQGDEDALAQAAVTVGQMRRKVWRSTFAVMDLDHEEKMDITKRFDVLLEETNAESQLLDSLRLNESEMAEDIADDKVEMQDNEQNTEHTTSRLLAIKKKAKKRLDDSQD